MPEAIFHSLLLWNAKICILKIDRVEVCVNGECGSVCINSQQSSQTASVIIMLTAGIFKYLIKNTFIGADVYFL